MEFGRLKIEHSVEGRSWDGNLSGPGLIGVKTQPVTDDLRPSRELALNAGSFIVAAVAMQNFVLSSKHTVSSIYQITADFE